MTNFFYFYIISYFFIIFDICSLCCLKLFLFYIKCELQSRKGLHFRTTVRKFVYSTCFVTICELIFSVPAVKEFNRITSKLSAIWTSNKSTFLFQQRCHWNLISLSFATTWIVIQIQDSSVLATLWGLHARWCLDRMTSVRKFLW